MALGGIPAWYHGYSRVSGPWSRGLLSCAVGDSGPGERESIVSVLDPRQNQCHRPQHHWHGHLVLGEIIGAVPGKESWYRSEAALHQFKFPANDGRIVIPRSLRKNKRIASWFRHVPAVFRDRLQIED